MSLCLIHIIYGGITLRLIGSSTVVLHWGWLGRDANGLGSLLHPSHCHSSKVGIKIWSLLYKNFKHWVRSSLQALTFVFEILINCVFIHITENRVKIYNVGLKMTLEINVNQSITNNGSLALQILIPTLELWQWRLVLMMKVAINLSVIRVMDATITRLAEKGRIS